MKCLKWSVLRAIPMSVHQGLNTGTWNKMKNLSNIYQGSNTGTWNKIKNSSNIGLKKLTRIWLSNNDVDVCNWEFETTLLGLLAGMPNLPYVYGKDFIEVLKKKHASKGYKEMVSGCRFLSRDIIRICNAVKFN